MKNVITTLCTLFITSLCSAQIGWMSTFESQHLAKADTFWNGSDLSGGFTSGQAWFKNNYNEAWKVWDGVGVSNTTDTTTGDYTNQYSVISGSGVNYTKQYAVVSQQATVVLQKQQVVRGVYINNGTYPVISMRNGDGFAKKFGGSTGDDPDYFKVTATGYAGTDSSTTDFYLADYRFADNSKDYIVTDWTLWNLESLGDVDSIVFSLESSDTGQYGMNTPAFFCMDNFNADSLTNTYKIVDLFFDYQTNIDSFENGSNHDGGFENNGVLFVNEYNKDWNSWSGWALSSMTDTVTADYKNQYSCIAGKGFSDKTYLTGYQSAQVLFPYTAETHFKWLATREYWIGVNNSTYGYLTMRDGNAFAKKFGGTTGNDKDYLVLKACGTLHSGEKTDTIAYYLADFRNDDNSKDYIQHDWSYWDIAEIIANKPVVRLDFWVEGSDTGQYGLNTPAYFCVDNIFPLIGSTKKTTQQRLTIYPNPASDVIHLSVERPIEQVNVYDVTGTVMTAVDGRDQHVDIGHLTAGMYFLEVITDQGRVTKQFIKQ